MRRTLFCISNMLQNKFDFFHFFDQIKTKRSNEVTNPKGKNEVTRVFLKKSLKTLTEEYYYY